MVKLPLIILLGGHGRCMPSYHRALLCLSLLHRNQAISITFSKTLCRVTKFSGCLEGLISVSTCPSHSNNPSPFLSLAGYLRIQFNPQTLECPRPCWMGTWQPDLVRGNWPTAQGWSLMDFKVPSKPTHAMIL